MKVTPSEERDDLLNVGENGYVRLVDVMGSDLSVVNAARASYAKESQEFSKSDAGLVRFLAREGHMSPFRHAFFTWEFKAPLMVARQHWKYVVGSDHTMDSWNEASRRYITMEPEFYIPKADEWRSKPDNSKQGSGPPIDHFEGQLLTTALVDWLEKGEALYKWAMTSLEVAPEQARLFLGAYGMQTIYRWSCSLQSLILFLNQRLAHDAQAEITAYANAVYRLAYDHFPFCLNELVDTRPDNVG